MHSDIPVYFLVTDEGGVLSMATSMVPQNGLPYVEELRNRKIDKLYMFGFNFIKAFGVIDGGREENKENT